MIFSAGAVGLILGGLSSSFLLKRFGTAQSLILARWIIVAAFLLEVFAHTMVILGLAIGLYYFASSIYGTIGSAYRLEQAPDALQGRVNSFNRMLSFGGSAAGGVLTGIFIERMALGPTMG